MDGDPTNVLPTGTDTAGANTANALQPTGEDVNGDGEPDSYPEGDTDGDGVLDQLDLDADNDGIPDVVEAGGTDVNGDGRADDYVDADNDGFNDVVDGDPTNVLTAGTDTAGANTANALLPTGADTNGDGAPDSYPNGDLDGDGVLNHLDLDADNDGILDIVEAGGTDANGDGQEDNYVDADGDGFNDVVDGDPTNVLPTGNDGAGANTANATTLTGEDTDGDGQPNSYPNDNLDGDNNLNFLDIDADNDGIVDNTEGQPTIGYVAPAGSDADGDGIDDAYDNDDANFGGAGSGITPENTDGADNPDYLDLDTDNDGEPDVIEGHDTNGDGVVNGSDAPNANTGLAGGTTDADGDGLLDGFDNDVASTDATNTTLNPNSHPDVDVPGTLERDWRESNTTYAINDVNSTIVEVAVSGQVLTNDIDPQGDNLAVTAIEVDTDGDGVPDAAGTLGAVTTVAGIDENGVAVVNAGTLTQNANGTYTFTPTTGFAGEVIYSYTMCDDGTPVVCDEARVTIDVIPAPTTTNGTVIVTPDVNVTYQGLPVSGQVLSNDSDPDLDNIAVSGTIQIDTDGDGQTDGTAPLGIPTIIAGVNSAGGAVTNAGTLIQNTNGTYTFTPTADFVGQVEYEYATCDDATPINCEQTTVTIYVLPAKVGNTTNANDDEVFGDKGSPIISNVLPNDTDLEGDDQSTGVSLVTGPTNGTVVLNPDGSYTYTPTNPNFVGNDEFTYSVCDDGTPVACDTATVYITILDVNKDYGDAVGYPEAWHRAILDVNTDSTLDGTNDVWLGLRTDFELTTIANDEFDDGIVVGSNPGNFPTAVLGGTSFNLDITVNSSQPTLVQYGLWIDWDNDGTYEQFYGGSRVTASPAVAVQTVNVPAGYSGTNTVNVRLRVDDEPLVAADFAGGKTNGEVEDYRVEVIDLPVELLSFTARLQGQNLGVLDWVTATETNNAGFEVEHALPGTTNFQNIGYVQGAGTTVLQQNYRYEVPNLVAGVHYFRIKQVDFDGTYSYSEIRALEVTAGEQVIRLYPNPAINQAQIDFSEPVVGEIEVEVYDNIGQRVWNKTVANQQSVQIELADLAAANYLVRVTTMSGTKTFKLIVRRD